MTFSNWLCILLLAALDEPDPLAAMPLLPPVRLTGKAVSLYWHSVDVQRQEFPIGSHHLVLNMQSVSITYSVTDRGLTRNCWEEGNGIQLNHFERQWQV